MLKKFIHINLSVILMVATTGFTLSMHYCGSHLVSTSINKEAKSCCDMGGCCDNKTLHLEVEDDFMSSTTSKLVETVELQLLFPLYFDLDHVSHVQESKVIHEVYNPFHPPGTKIRLAILQTYLC